MKKFFLFFKKYWKIAAVILGLIASFLLLRKRESDLLNHFKEIRSEHEKELKKINEEREQERLLQQKNEQRFKESLKVIEEQYSLEKKELDKKKKKEIDGIVQRYGDDPDELAVQLSKATGFKIILPEQELTQ